MNRTFKFLFLATTLFFSKITLGQLSRVSIIYNTGNLYHDISQFKYHYTDFFGGINAGLEFNLHKKWNIGVLYTNFYMNRLLPDMDKQERIYKYVSDDLYSLPITRKQEINKNFEWHACIEPTLRYSFVSWADRWTQGGPEPHILVGGYHQRKEIGLKLLTAIRYIPFKNERATVDLYFKRSYFQNTPNFSQLGLGFGYAFYKKKQK